jgi:hypothetical protein
VGKFYETPHDAKFGTQIQEREGREEYYMDVAEYLKLIDTSIFLQEIHLITCLYVHLL